MLSKTLNIIGVFLNFLAGIMMAPEAIGVENIKRLENKIEVASGRILREIERMQKFINQVGWNLKILPFTSREIVLSMFVFIPITILVSFNIESIASWIQHILLCLLNPIYEAQNC